MPDSEWNLVPAPAGRLLSLDFFRGLTMFLLIGEATGIYALLVGPGVRRPVSRPSARSSTTTPGTGSVSGT